MNTQTELTAERIDRYIRRIRNVNKREYAKEYRRFLNGFRQDEPQQGPISYMAAQAVRMNLADLKKINTTMNTHTITPAERLAYAKAKAEIARSITNNKHLIAIWPGKLTQ